MAEDNASLNDIEPEQSIDGNSDSKARAEWTQHFSTSKTKPQLQNERFHLQTSIIRDEHRRRWWVLILGYLSVMVWLGFTLVIVVMQGCSGGSPQPMFRLDDRVLLAFMGIGAVHMLGSIHVASKYVFPHRPWWLKRAHDAARSRRS